MTDLDNYWRLANTGNTKQALAAAENVLAFDPHNADAAACKAVVQWRLGGNIEAAMGAVRRAIKQAPFNLVLQQQLAQLYSATGDAKRAEAQYRRCLDINPRWAPALIEMARMRRFTEIDDVARGLLDIHRSPSVPDELRRSVGFALGKIHDDLKRYDEAFSFFADANANMTQHVPNPERDETTRKHWTAFFKGRGLEGKPRSKVNSDAPVYIVGLPRSGTTLVETTLGAHPRVHNCGELSMVGLTNSRLAMQVSGKRVINAENFLAALDADEASKTREARAILDEMAASAPKKAKILTDKMPHNLLLLPLISLLFAKARIIYVRRHPLDCGLSIFQTPLSKFHPYSADLEAIGRHYRFMVDMFELFRPHVDNPILDLSYDLLVADPEAQSARMFAFLGLDWQRSMMNRQTERKSVATASIYQVRQPIHTRSRERWRAYEPWLRPMIEAMGGMEWVEAQAAASRRMGAEPPAVAAE